MKGTKLFIDIEGPLMMCISQHPSLRPLNTPILLSSPAHSHLQPTPMLQIGGDPETAVLFNTTGLSLMLLIILKSSVQTFQKSSLMPLPVRLG